MASNKDEQLFEVEVIQDCIWYLWKFYFSKLFITVFLPYCVFFIIFLVYSSYLYTGPENRMNKANIAVKIASLIGVVFFFTIEFRQIRAQRKKYLKLQTALFWNIIDVSSNIMVLAFVICDFSAVEFETGRSVSSVAMLLLWVKLFYFLRIFKPTASFMRMVSEILKDMSTFTFILFLAFFAIANSFYILDGGPSEKTERVSGETYSLTWLTAYQAGLGAFGTDDYDDSSHRGMLWTVFFICTFLIQIVLLNLLIALMGDTFDKVQEIR